MLAHVLRFIVAAMVVLFFGFLLPGFSVLGFWTALGLALLVAAVGWVAESLFLRRASPYSRGLIGFAVTAFVLFSAQFLFVHVRISAVGALVAALLVGVVDAFVPVEVL